MSSLDILNRFHDRHAGASDRVFGGLDAGGGRSSYDRLVERVPAEARRVLDLACGDGPLVARLRARPGRPTVIGLDQSRAELAAAARRLGSEEGLVRGLAAELPFEDGAFDAVTCHMALMLMDEPERVLMEIRRVLAPDGALVFVVGRFTGAPPGHPEIWAWLRARWREEALRMRLGDDRWGSAEGVAELLAAGFEGLELEAGEGVRQVPVHELADYLTLAYYPVDALSEDGKRALAAFLAERAPELAPDGALPWPTPFWLGSARRG